MFEPGTSPSYAAMPATVKRLIIATAIVTVLSAMAQSIFELFDLFPGPQNYLSLSWWGLKHLFLWQPISYLFVQNSPAGVTFFFLLKLFFTLYIIWVIGGIVYELLGKRSFLRLYILGGMAAGLITILSMRLFGVDEMLAGALPSVLILVTVWTMAMPETEVLLFFLIPLKVKWLVLYAFGAIALTTLSEFDFPGLFLYVSSVLIGFVYSVAIHHWRSPYPHTKKLEDYLIMAGDAIRLKTPSWMRFQNGTKRTNEGKIVDIDHGQPIQDDDAFVDAMLIKISKSGEESLSWSEKRRLKQISEKRMKDK